MSYFDYLDDEEKAEYDQKYYKSIRELAGDVPEGELEDYFEELQALRYDPSGNAKQDAELNFLRAEKKVRGKNPRKHPAIDSYAKYMKSQGRSNESVNRMIRKARKGGR